MDRSTPGKCRPTGRRCAPATAERALDEGGGRMQKRHNPPVDGNNIQQHSNQEANTLYISSCRKLFGHPLSLVALAVVDAGHRFRHPSHAARAVKKADILLTTVVGIALPGNHCQSLTGWRSTISCRVRASHSLMATVPSPFNGFRGNINL